MNKGDPLSLRADPRNVVNEPGPGRAAPLERCVEIVHSKADVMNRGASLRDEPSNRRVGLLRLEQLDYRPASVESDDPRAVGIGQIHLPQSEYLPVEGKNLGDRAYGNPDMGDSRALWA